MTAAPKRRIMGTTGKKPVQMRMDEALKRDVAREAERQGVSFTKYLEQLAEDAHFVSTVGSPYVRLLSHRFLHVTGDGTMKVTGSERILLNRDSKEYQFNFRLDVWKVRRLYPSVRHEDIRIIREHHVRIPKFADIDYNKGSDGLSAEGGARTLAFPNQVKGTELVVEWDVLLSGYALRGSPKPGDEYVRDRHTLPIDAPTDELTFELAIDREFYAHDLANGRLTESQIADALRVEMGTNASTERRGVVEADRARYQIDVARDAKSDDQFHLSFHARRPIFGMLYRISWVAPSNPAPPRRR